MRCKEIRPVIRTANLRETVDFYVNSLGFTCGGYSEEWGWASFHRDDIEIMAAVPNAHMPFEKPLFTGSIYITVDDADAFWEEFRDKARVFYPIEDFDFGMREFALLDNNGYLLQFGHPIA
ncbi:MAG: VOC family protein [Bacteroidia bacterium]|nr:VOC family protein [Bacteroidia bacterium]